MCFMCAVSHGLFALPLGVIGRLCSVIVAILGHLHNYFICYPSYDYIDMLCCQNCRAHNRKIQTTTCINKSK